jgi:GTP-binding protein HflX
LANAVSDALSRHFLDVDVETGVDNGRLLAYLAKTGEILSRTYADDRVSIHCRLPRKYLARIGAEDAVVRLRSTGQLWRQNGATESHGAKSSNGVARGDHTSADGQPMHDVA